MSMQIRIEGLAAAEAAFPETVVLKKVLGTAVSKGAQVYRKGIRAKSQGAFKDTATKRRAAGTLRKDIRYKRVTKLGGISAQAGPLGDRVAHLIEGGHGGPRPAPAHPFVGPAFSEYEDAAVAAAEAVIFAAIDAL